ncbi:MAG: hypothetical protein AB7P69_26975, partial [Candidatus Binatia bacterium]
MTHAQSPFRLTAASLEFFPTLGFTIKELATLSTNSHIKGTRLCERLKRPPSLQETVAWAPASSQVVTLCDREADIYEFLVEAQQLEAKGVLRA